MLPDTAFRSEETFTQEEFRRWLEERAISDDGRYELLRGRIVMTPPAGYPHGELEAVLVASLHDHVKAGKLGTVRGSSAGFDLPSGDTVEPDVSYVSTQRQAESPTPERGRFLRVVPNLVVEILSRPTARRDRTEKLQIYERNGVDEYWIVDPDERAVVVFVLHGDRYDPGTSVTQGPIPSVALPDLLLAVEEIFNG
jgi:Uma2 family endonuclease